MENSMMVLGPLAAVALGLLAYVIYVWLQYYEEANRMQSREAQYNQQSRASISASEQARAKTGQTLEYCRVLEEEVAALRQQLSELRQASSGDHE